MSETENPPSKGGVKGGLRFMNKLAEFKFNYDSPIICTAIHNGHDISEEVEKNLVIAENIRLREEDPFTDRFITSASNTIIGRTSRFEVDLNRTAEKCIYLEPADAWGLSVRKERPSPVTINKSLTEYNRFYSEVKKHLEIIKQKFGNFFVFDVHSYNHHRQGADEEFDDPELNPDIIIGTSNMPAKWQPLIDKIVNELAGKDFFGKKLDVRVNVKFPGGNFSRWIHENFPESGCSVSIEFKKIWMDEWTGEVYDDKQKRLKDLLESTFKIINSNLALI